jgi:hypothetical protein
MLLEHRRGSELVRLTVMVMYDTLRWALKGALHMGVNTAHKHHVWDTRGMDIEREHTAKAEIKRKKLLEIPSTGVQWQGVMPRRPSKIIFG